MVIYSRRHAQFTKSIAFQPKIHSAMELFPVAAEMHTL